MKRIAKSISVKDAVFTYTSKCCTGPATKPACVKVDAKAAETNSLGSWRCTTCRKPCSVFRTRNKDAQ